VRLGVICASPSGQTPVGFPDEGNADPSEAMPDRAIEREHAHLRVETVFLQVFPSRFQAEGIVIYAVQSLLDHPAKRFSLCQISTV
jgi:hypothetical protein